MSLAIRIPNAPPHRLSGALEGVAYGLGLLHEHMLRMQNACCAPERGQPLDAALVRELQGLDLAAQQLDALSIFVRAMSEALPFDPAMDLSDTLKTLTLRDVADTLGAWSAGAPPPAPKPVDAGVGDFHLF